VSSSDDRGSIGGLAKRWLKNQLQVHGDPRRAYRERQESEAIEEEIKDRAQEDLGRAVFNALAPAGLKEKLAGMERHKQEQAHRDVERRRAEHEARPRANVELHLTGDVTGFLTERMPVVLNHPEEAGAALALELSPLNDAGVGGRPFQALMFAIPGYAGAGQYDLSAIAHANGTDDWDPFWFQLILDSEDEPFYWVPDYGRGLVTVEPDERTIKVNLPMENAGSERVQISATVTLP
jgi:hypothetical protein